MEGTGKPFKFIKDACHLLDKPSKRGVSVFHAAEKFGTLFFYAVSEKMVVPEVTMLVSMPKDSCFLLGPIWGSREETPD